MTHITDVKAWLAVRGRKRTQHHFEAVMLKKRSTYQCVGVFCRHCGLMKTNNAASLAAQRAACDAEE